MILISSETLRAARNELPTSSYSCTFITHLSRVLLKWILLQVAACLLLHDAYDSSPRQQILSISNRRSESDRVNTGFHRSSQVPAGGEPLVKHIEINVRLYTVNIKHTCDTKRVECLYCYDWTPELTETKSIHRLLTTKRPKNSTKLPIPEGSFKASHACLLHREI